MKRSRTLYQLQKLETDMGQKARRLKEVEASIKETDELMNARAAAALADKRLKEARSVLHQIQADSQDLQTQAAGEEKRLYSGRIANPKELASLQDKIKNLKQRRTRLEDDELTGMVEIEEAETQLRECLDMQARVEAEWTASQGTLVEERDRLRKELARAINERAAMRQAASPADLTFYENLARRKGGIGVARIINGACRGCGVTVPPRQAAAVYDTDELIVCMSCERILYGER